MPLRRTTDPRAALFFSKFGSRKLNLRSGQDRRPGYINIDMHSFQNPDLVANILDLSDLPSSGFEEVVAQDVLEHFRWRDTPRALLEWNRLLKTGGRIFLRTTYLNGLFRLFEATQLQSVEMQLVLLMCLFSNQTVDGDYHLTAFPEGLMRFYLWASGFEIDQISVRDGWLFQIWATKKTDFTHLDLVEEIEDDNEFVRQMYQRVLEREPDPAGFEAFASQLKAGAICRADLVKLMVLSEENQMRLAAKCPAFKLEFNQPNSLSNPGRHFALQEAERLVAHSETTEDRSRFLTGYWHHAFELSDGSMIHGGKSLDTLNVEFEAVFGSLNLAGQSVLDIGAWNGAFSFEAERRGAARVVAVDEFVWLHPELKGLEKFLYIRKDRDSQVEYRIAGISETNVQNLGEFDLVLFLGVFYHLADPLSILNTLAEMTRLCLVLETHLDAEGLPYPAMRYYPGAELNGDPTNWWGPNPACVEALLRAAGFSQISFYRNHIAPSRGFFHAWK